MTDSEIEAVRALGYESVPEALAATGRAIERGHHVALIASEGSGRRALFGYAVGRLCDPASTAPQALVLTPTREAGVRAARAAARFAAESGIRVEVMPAAGSPAEEDGWPHAVVGRPTRILAAVRSGLLGLGAIRLLVIDGVGAMHALEEWSSVEALMDGLGKEAQKIVVSDEWNDEFASLLTRQLPRARRWPEELFGSASDGGDVAGNGRHVTVGVAGTHHERYELVVESVRRARAAGSQSITVVCLDANSAPLVEDHLAAHGLYAREESTGIAVTAAPAEASGDAVILVGLPAGLAAIQAAFVDVGEAFLIVDASDAKQAELTVKRAGWSVETIAVPPVDGSLDNVSRFRSRLRSQLVRQDDSADLLLLEPVLEEFGAVRVAAALSSLLRQRADSDVHVRPWADVEASSVQPPGVRPPRGVRKAWSKVYVGAGRRDDVRPGDLVGAITGETSAVGGQIGKIEIRGNFSLVDIDSQIVDEVIGALDGTTIKGRQAAVRLDREP